MFDRPPLWEPSEDDREQAAVTRFMRWAGTRRGDPFADYGELWRWSVDELEEFWSFIWEFCEVRASEPYRRVLDSHAMPGANWFEGAELNYAENVLEGLRSRGARDPDAVALLYCSEARELDQLTWGELSGKVAAAAEGLRSLGVARGDRVVAYLPNVPEAVIALLAVASIGAIWSSAAPEFGARSVIDRFAQIEPKVLLAVDGYRQGGQDFERMAAVEGILEELPTVAHVILVPYLSESPKLADSLTWEELLGLGEGAPASYEQVPFDHPLWVLYSSGTTGLPKAIVQGHGGILLEQLKHTLHLDLRPGDRMLWFSTTGWMMWNFLIGCLLSDAAIVLYDGSPTHPDFGAPWRLAERAGITCMGTSAAMLASCEKAGVRPEQEYDLSALRAIGSTGSPLAPESFRWIYEQVGSKIWLFSMSGGTDVCTAFLAGCPVLPVYEGELQCRALGCAVESWDAQGNSLIDEVGELVLREPMPSMPLFFWGDANGERMRESYFSMYPGIWRHGDWVRITPRGGAVIYGRSDSTINRQGVRIGTSEIYRAAAAVPAVVDALALDVPRRGEEGELSLMLFVVLAPDVSLDDQLSAQIKQRIREDCSARHVPNEIRQIEQVPRTLSGKVLEVPVKRVLMGAEPSEAASVDSLANPASLDYFVELAQELARDPLDDGSAEGAEALARQLDDLDEADRDARVLELLCGHVTAVLGSEPTQRIDTGRRFAELGFDSLGAVELRVRLERSLGLRLPWMLIFEHPTPAALARYLRSRVEGRGPREATQGSDLDAALAAIRLGSVAPRMPPIAFKLRLKTSTLVREVLPTEVVVRRAAQRGQAIWEQSAKEREQAIAAMEPILVGTPRARDLEEIARRHLIEQPIDRALFWQPRWSAKLDAESDARLRTALSGDRGVLLSVCHLGPYYMLHRARAFDGRDTYLVAGSWFFQAPSHDLWGRRLARWRKGTKSYAVPSDGSFPIVEALLERGDAVFLHFDMPGPHETRFLGKSAMLAEGSAQLAVRADALVLPLRARRVGHEVWLDAAAPLDPREHADADRLHDALAVQHEHWILQNPAAIEAPAARGRSETGTPNVVEFSPLRQHH